MPLNWSCLGFPQAAVFQVLLQHGSAPWGPSFRSGLLQHRSMWAAAPPVLCCRLLCKGCSSSLTLLLQVLSMGYTSSTPSTAILWAPLWLHVEICMVPMGCRWTTCSSMGLSCAGRNFCSLSGAPPALLLSWPWWLQGGFCHVFSPTVVSPFLKSAVPEAHTVLLIAQLCQW